MLKRTFCLGARLQPCRKREQCQTASAAEVGLQRLQPASALKTIRLLIAALLAFTTLAHAQQIGGNKPAGPGQGADSGYTLSVKSQLVIETVTVKDKSGKPIPNLTAKDFTLTEDGAPQVVKFCEHQQLPTGPDTPIPPPTAEDITIYKRLARTQVAPEREGDSEARYRNKRLIALYFDMTAMRPAEQQRALGAAEKFVRTRMSASDVVSILRYTGGSVDVLQDFSADRNRLLSILETLVVGEGQGSVESIDDASSVDTGAAFGQDSSEFNIFNTDRQLSALQTTAKMLGQLSEKKALIYFASGLRLNGVDNQAQLHATVDSAIRAGVSFWPVDARGLVAGAPLGDATQGSPGGISTYSGTAAQATNDRFQQSQDTLFALAGDTGGKALFDNNDLGKGIVEAQQSIGDYYILGYYTTNSEPNGKFRKVTIKLADTTAKLDYRQGYFGAKVFAKFTVADKERQLEDALMLGDPVTELTVAMEIDYFQLNRAEYFVPIVVKIPGRELALAKRGGAEHTLIDFVGEIKDVVGGNTVGNVRDKVSIKLTDATAAELTRRPIEYDAGFTLLPGRYTIKFLARDDETGRIGTFQTNFTIPNLNKEATHVPISSVVLSGQKVALKDALFDAMHGKEQAREQAADPLVLNGARLIPSVTRVFSRDRQLFVYLQAYQPGASPTTMVGFVTLYRDGAKALETSPVAITGTASSKTVQAVPLSFTVALAKLPPGEYDCQVTVLDPTGSRATFWSAPIAIVE